MHPFIYGTLITVLYISASIAFDWSNAIWAKPKPLLQAERENKSGKPKWSLFFCWMNEIVVAPR